MTRYNTITAKKEWALLERMLAGDFNPNHDPKTGQFASGSASSGISSRTISKGGISIHAKTGREPKDGFMVAMYGDRSKWLQGEDVSDPIKREHAIKAYMKENDELLSDPDNYLGTWYDTETGAISLDISRCVKDREEAVRTAAEHNEKAIWDVKAMAEIPTGGKGNNW